MNPAPYSEMRRDLINNHIRPAGVTDEYVLKAMMVVPRHEFVPEKYQKQAYEDHPLPIGKDQTISQPSLVALMTQLLDLKGDETVLEIGTGSGYQTAILSLLSKKVVTIERLKSLADRARVTLKKLGYSNITVVKKDGSYGYKKEAPYHRVMITAAADTIPKLIVSQLKENGKIVIPLRENGIQMLYVGIKKNKKLLMREVERVSFVPMIVN